MTHHLFYEIKGANLSILYDKTQYGQIYNAIEKVFNNNDFAF